MTSGPDEDPKQRADIESLMRVRLGELHAADVFPMVVGKPSDGPYLVVAGVWRATWRLRDGGGTLDVEARSRGDDWQVVVTRKR